MKISQASENDLTGCFNQIAALCGYPVMQSEKSNVIIPFIKHQIGHHTTDELLDAYRSLAAGCLDEKLDSFKSLTGLSICRVLQAHQRNKKEKPTDYDESNRVSEATTEILKEKTGRIVRYYDEVTDEDKILIMDHWLAEQVRFYRESHSVYCITTTSFDFLMKQGRIRIENNNIQMFRDERWMHLVSVDECKRCGQAIYNEELKNMNSKSISAIWKVNKGDETWKRYAVSLYFENLQP